MKIRPAEKISVIALVLLITGAIDSVRNLPATALFGPSLIFFFIFSACVFLIPVALISAELASKWPEEEGGIYSWVQRAFGNKMAFVTIWLQWVNTIVWYPSILLFIAGVLAYLIDPQLAQNQYYLVSVVLSVFWLLTILGLLGLKASALFASICAILGMILPMALIIILALVWIIKGNPVAIDVNFQTVFPQWKDINSWVSLTAIMTSFLGMELAAVHVRDIRDPQKNYPKAMLFSVILILTTMIFGSLAIAFVLPQKEINLVAGVMQAFTHFLTAYHLEALTPVIVFLILIGSLGSMVNWIISPAKGLLLAVGDGFLPNWFYYKNKNNIASRILIVQALLVTLCCLVFLCFPSVNAIYWLFTALSTELYILMYLILFVAAWQLKKTRDSKKNSFIIPGGTVGYYSVCLLGVFGCLITLIVGFFPPETMNMGGVTKFRVVFLTGIIIMVSPPLLLLWRKKRIHELVR